MQHVIDPPAVHPVTLDAELAANYRALHDARGCTWEQLALEQDAEAAAAQRRSGGLIGQDAPHRRLATWFRQEAVDAGEPSPEQREGTTPEPAVPGPAKRTATPNGPKRTA